MSGGWAGSDRRSELPADWPQRRALVLDRDGHRCRWHEHGVACGKHATEVDHIKPGNDHRPENLQVLCTDHHAIKSSREGNAARWAVRRQRPAERHPGLI
ncbi:HNH endonuclease signature motif containing protein [Streptomyces boncukensis]|uniref:HNH endonuclease n=1 Tax=Streptomyces boncukensis TaxID=2711219 RepID=A0A6G4WUM4_9ACTN|nr:HNH endonuclease [Streptomyces boncukensis]